jgi:bacillolysin
MTKTFRFGATVSALLVAVTVSVALLQAQTPRARSGFRALTGPAAAAFAVPADMRLVAREPGSAARVAAERYRQFVGSAEMLGGQITIYTDNAGVRTAVIGAHYPDVRPAGAIRLGPVQAQAIAAARRPALTGDWQTDLMIHPDTAVYFYRVEVRATDSRWFTWVDAETGEVVNEYDGFATQATADDVGVLGDNKDLTGLTTKSSGSYRMQLLDSDRRIDTYDARNRQTLPGVLAADADDVWNTTGRTSPGQPALVDAHFYASVTDSYYRTRRNFNWFQRYAQGMRSSVHVGRNYNNAGWNGTQMIYGDGDGISFLEFSGDLDVVGHELSHGVTEATSNLVYQNESGALNEAFSDIMGTAIEFYYGSGNWTIGEDITPGANGLRNMANPNEDGDPSHYADRYTGTGDNGGVHINSGIANHWFYLLVNGGENANPGRRDGTGVSGLGMAQIEAAANIAHLGFTALPATANFCAARASTIAVAASFAANVAAAWDEVGVDLQLCGGGSSGDTTGPVISNVVSQKLKGTKFKVSWTTDEPSGSAVSFSCCGSYTSAALVTSHSMTFTGSNGVAYQYYVTSTDASGNTTTAGPFTHQN